MPGKRKAIQQPDGSFIVELKPGGTKVRTVAEPDDFDAHQFEVLAGGLDLPRTARGGVRDLAPDDARPTEARMTHDAAMPSEPAPTPPTLAETQERRAYTEGKQPQQWDTVYQDSAEEARQRRIRAAALRGARVRHGEDVHYYDPEKPVSL